MGGCQNHESVTPEKYKTNSTRIIGGASSSYPPVNPWRACAARVTVLSVCLTTVLDRTLKFRLQRSTDDTLECFNAASRDMAIFVSQEAYIR